MQSTIILYTKENCGLCEQAKDLLESLQLIHSFQIEERDIYTNDQWLEQYQLMIPVVEIGRTQFYGEQLQPEVLEAAIIK
ncbi:glutaredoxin family protein [Oceanobacillus manasiensis]|uniref:glutaredoxin family protein n=1 Tax=Oceanobacillus manasiensis TaxID=586413 RepID=UPI0005AA98BE|nr:glutaredoxin family protein [Oceanobacillus manasiensis]